MKDRWCNPLRPSSDLSAAWLLVVICAIGLSVAYVLERTVAPVLHADAGPKAVAEETVN